MKQRILLYLTGITSLLLAAPVFAQGGEAAAGAGTNWVAITSGFAMAIASAVCGLAQGKAASAACEGVARNPGARTAIQPALFIGLAFIESLVLFTFVLLYLRAK